MVTVYQRAIAEFGADKQIECVIEECLELALVLQHAKRKKAGVKEIVDEVADVEIMLKQLRIILNENAAIFERKCYKIARLTNRIFHHHELKQKEGSA